MFLKVDLYNMNFFLAFSNKIRYFGATFGHGLLNTRPYFLHFRGQFPGIFPIPNSRSNDFSLLGRKRNDILQFKRKRLIVLKFKPKLNSKFMLKRSKTIKIMNRSKNRGGINTSKSYVFAYNETRNIDIL